MNNLRVFNQKKSEILLSLNQAIKLARHFGLTHIAEDFKIVQSTLEREQFEIIVAGEFSNGKSTFINALMKEEILPSSTVPTTAFINKLYYHDQPVFKACYTNKKEKELTREEFLNLVSDDKNKIDGKSLIKKWGDKLKNITHLEIGCPSPLIENGIILIDSPGTNENNEHRVQITNDYIPRSDAAIFLLNATQVFKASEKAFLQRILDADIQKIFFVINFKDCIKNEEEFIEIEKIVKNNLPEGLESPKIFFVSALHALNHYKKASGHNEVKPLNRRAARKQAAILPIEETGMAEFEGQLIEFLSRESGTEKLRKPVERANRLLKSITDHIDFERNSLNHNIGDIQLRVNDIHKQLKAVERDINHRANQISKRMVSAAENIVRWYSQELNKVAEIAEEEMLEGIAYKDDPEVIKENIDLATAKIEKQLSEQLPKKIQEAINTIILDEDQQLNRQLGQLTQTFFCFSENEQSWGEKIIRREQQVKRNSDDAIGAAILGGLALFATGGTLGWGLLGAGLGGATYHYITKKEDDASMYGRLKTQVKERYGGSVAKKTKGLEIELKRINQQLQQEYKKVVAAKIEQERKHTNMLIQNQHLETAEVERKIADLDEQLSICDSIRNDLQGVLTAYINSVSTREVNLDERIV